MAKVKLELLHGRRVVDCDGRFAGRVLCVLAERSGDRDLVTEILLGVPALLEQLGVSFRSLAWWRGLGAEVRPLRVRWDQLDWSDLERPRLRCALDEIER